MNEIIVETDLNSFDRSSQLPISTLYLWGQKCRLQLYFAGSLLQLRQTVGPMMVKAQSFQFTAEDLIPKVNTRVKVSQKVGSIGKTSLTFALSFQNENDVEFAIGYVTMVCVADGKAQPLPQDFIDSLRKELTSEPSAQPEFERITALRSTNELIEKDSINWEVVSTLQVLLRNSDEDTNKHVRHTKYAMFFEDVLQELPNGVATKRYKYLSVDYIKECHRNEVLIVTMKKDKHSNRALLLTHRNEELVCKGFGIW